MLANQNGLTVFTHLDKSASTGTIIDLRIGWKFRLIAVS
jgi:hypothetical protein